MQQDRAAQATGLVETAKRVLGDGAAVVRDFVVGIARRCAIYLPFTGAIASLRFWLRQREIQAWMDSISQSYQQEMGKARLATAPAEELDEIQRAHHSEQKWAEDELRRLYHSYYVYRANRLRIPVPPFQEAGGAWVASAVGDGWYLTPEALHALRAEIRAERKARRDEWLAWMPLLALLVALLSVLTALLVVWKH